MTLRDFAWRIAYGASDDRLHDFYIPALERSIRFDRASGFFSSAALGIAAAGIARLLHNGGTMRLLCGAQLSEHDVEAIRRGADASRVVGDAMAGCLADPADQSLRARLEALAWMVANGKLEIRVVLPCDADGVPRPAEDAREYYHPKEGVFVDAVGNRLGFSGSVNDSINAWQLNYETFSVYTSWPHHIGADTVQGGPYLRAIEERFRRLWEGEEPNWIALDVPHAAREKLLKYRPDTMPPLLDPLERPSAVTPTPEVEVLYPPAPPGRPTRDEPAADTTERIVFEFLRSAPFLPNAGRLGIETSTVRPWPHQTRVVDAVVDRFPENFLFCDEVGLGKTIEAGLALRQLVVSGQVTRALLLVPRTVLRQWQEELYEKLVLNVPRLDGDRLVDVFGRDVPFEGRPWDAVPILLASSQLAKRRARQLELCAPDAKPWDLVIVDEAHHARRRSFQNGEYRPNRLLELLEGSGGRHGLKDRTRALWLLTATPMQVHPVEVWDLLRVLGMGGRWGASQQDFLDYFDSLRALEEPGARPDWDLLLDMFAEYRAMGGTIDEAFARAAEDRAGFVTWQAILSLPQAASRATQRAQLSSAGQAVLRELLRRHTPLKRYVWRNTRNLLRRYHAQGLLKENVPDREPENLWIALDEAPGGERDLYERIEEYISDFYRRYEARRKGLGFVMTVYRRRLTSSFFALRKSLERRRDFLLGHGAIEGLFTDDDVEQEELEFDLDETLDEEAGATAAEREAFRAELEYVSAFLHEISSLGVDSKIATLHEELKRFLAARETAIVFTQYTDTMDYLREELRAVYGAQVACYSGRGGEVWDGIAWVPRTKEEIKAAFRAGEDIKILLCTESASEGLNLQTCGVLINYDMPWNPMRVEQRIGRVDRIGQKYKAVWIRNFFYSDTVEATIYQRLGTRIQWFTTVVGELQPILHRVASSIEKLAMLSRSERQKRIDEEVAALTAAVDARDDGGLALDELLDLEETTEEVEPPFNMLQLERALVDSRSLGRRFHPHPRIAGAHRLMWHDGEHAVTFDPAVFDRHPSSVELLSFGNPLLDDLLQEVPLPPSSAKGAALLRLQAASLVPVVWYGARSVAGVEEVSSLTSLKAALAPDFSHNWEEPDVKHARSRFAAACERAAERLGRVAHEKREARKLAIRAAAREVLIEATLADALRDEREGFFGDGSAATLASAGVTGLAARESVPFRSLLNVVLGGEEPEVGGDHPALDEMRRLSDVSLQRRRVHAKNRGLDLLKQWRAVTTEEGLEQATVQEGESERWIDVPGQAVLPTTRELRT